jgi:hypothetical protein
MGRAQWQYSSGKNKFKGLKKHLKKREQQASVFRAPREAVEPADYATYMQSARWFDFRREWFRYTGFPRCCVGCLAPYNLELHHVTYERLGQERLNDCIPLCTGCHDRFHQTYSAAQCTGLKCFQFQMTVAFRITSDEAAERLYRYLMFSHDSYVRLKTAKSSDGQTTRRRKPKRGAKKRQRVAETAKLIKTMAERDKQPSPADPGLPCPF